MSVLSRVNWIGQQRVDLHHILAQESFGAADLRALVSAFSGVDRPYVLRGFEVVSKADLTLGIKVANSQVFNPQDGVGAFYVGKSSDADVNITLPANTDNIYVEAVFVSETREAVNVGIWDPLALSGEDVAGQEFSTSSDFEIIMKLSISYNTEGFSEGAIPLFKASTGAGIQSLVDSRPMMFRLGKGGATPDLDYKFPFSEDRDDPNSAGIGVGNDSDSPWRAFDANGNALNDKAITSFKEWADAVMTRISEITGNSLWYTSNSNTAPTDKISINQIFFDTLGHYINPSKTSAFVWTRKYTNSNPALDEYILKGSGGLSATSPHADGLISWSSNYSQLKWHLGGDFESASSRNYSNLLFSTINVPDGSNVYLKLDREKYLAVNPNAVEWRPATAISGLSQNKTVKGIEGDFTGLAINDYIRKETGGYNNYYKVVKFADSDGNIYNQANLVANETIIAVELEKDIDSQAEEVMVWFRSRYKGADLVQDDGTGSFLDTDYYWLGKRIGDNFILRDFGTLRPGQEANPIDMLESRGRIGGNSYLSARHKNNAIFESGQYKIGDTGSNPLITIRKRKSDNLQADFDGTNYSNDGGFLEYTIDGPISVGADQCLWVKLSDQSGGSLSAGSVRSSEDTNNIEENTNLYEVLDLSGGDSSYPNVPLNTYDNRNVFLLAKRIVLDDSTAALLFFDGSIIDDFGQAVSGSLTVYDRVRVKTYDDNGVPFTKDDGTKEVITKAESFAFVPGSLYSEGNLTLPNYTIDGTENLSSVLLRVQQDVNFLTNLGDYTLNIGQDGSTIDIKGDTKIRGNLTVEGETVTQNVNTVQAEDKTITLGTGLVTDYSFGGGLEVAGQATPATQAETASGSEDLALTVSISVSTGDKIQVSATEDVNGILAGEISGEYEIVASLSAQGQATYAGGILTLRTTGSATSTGTVTSNLPVVYKIPYSITITDENGNKVNTADVTSWTFENDGKKAVLTPVDGYETVVKGHSTRMIQGRLPFVNDDNQGFGADSTIDFSPNLTWDNTGKKLTVDGNVSGDWFTSAPVDATVTSGLMSIASGGLLNVTSADSILDTITITDGPQAGSSIYVRNATGSGLVVTNTGGNISTGTGENYFLRSGAIYEFIYYNSTWHLADRESIFSTKTISSTETLESDTYHLTDTSAGAFTVNLISGAPNAIIRISDAQETWHTDNLTIQPASGEKIDGLAIDEPLVCDVLRGWVELVWDDVNSTWAISSIATGQPEEVVSADLSINTHNDVDTASAAPVSGDLFSWDGTNWVPTANPSISSVTSDSYKTNTQSAAISSSVLTVTKGHVKISAGEAVLDTISGLAEDGKSLVLINNSGDNVKITNNGNITTGTGIDFTLKPSAAVSLVYSTSSWILSGGAGAGGGASVEVAQSAHGFVVGDVLYFDGTEYVKAKADAENTAEVVGIVSEVPDVDNFVATTAGYIEEGLSGLTAGSVYYLSSSTAGELTVNEPSVVGEVSRPVLLATAADKGFVLPYRGVVVGGSNARTSLSLNNNGSTNIQDMSGYDAGELSGWLYIDATSPLRFYLEAQVSKNGAGDDFNISYQTSGDTPPSGFDMNVSSAGVVSVVLPDVTGFASANINYSLNAAAVGVDLPLSISGENILEATSSVRGTIKKNRWQRKTISSNATSSAGLAGFQFSGLEVGKHYELKVLLKCGAGGGDGGLNVNIENGSSNTVLYLDVGGWLGETTANPVAALYGSVVFKASATSITFTGGSFNTTSFVYATNSFSLLTERNDLEDEVDIW